MGHNKNTITNYYKPLLLYLTLNFFFFYFHFFVQFHNSITHSNDKYHEKVLMLCLGPIVVTKAQNHGSVTTLEPYFIIEKRTRKEV